MVDPKIAILIPAYNEELVIEGTISALVQAGADRKDIYLVDDRSKDRTADISRDLGVNVHTVPQNGGKARAQTQAIAHFGLCDGPLAYDWIIFLDGDTKVDVKFLKVMREAAINDPSVALYVGQVKSVKNSHLYSASRAFDYTYGQDVAKAGQSNFNVIFVSPGCSSMYRCDVLKDLHIDHLTLAEDMDLTMQVHRKGGVVKYLAEASVNTQDPATLKDYHKQVLRWYRGFWQVVKKHEVFGFRKKQRVDWYMIVMTLDALLFNKAFWLVVMAIAYPSLFLIGFAGDFVVSFIIALYSGYRTKRSDVVWKFPLYYWIGYLNFYAYTRAFIEIVLLKKTLLDWNKVKRYDFNNHAA